MEKDKKSEGTLKTMKHCGNSDLRKSKHRFADSKYRQNVQFLYRLLKKDCYENFTKDVLLTTVSDDIKRMHNDIIHLVGSQKLEKYNDKFLEIVEIGESIWAIKGPSAASPTSRTFSRRYLKSKTK